MRRRRFPTPRRGSSSRRPDGRKKMCRHLRFLNHCRRHWGAYRWRSIRAPLRSSAVRTPASGFPPSGCRPQARAYLLVRFLAGRATAGNVENPAGHGAVLQERLVWSLSGGTDHHRRTRQQPLGVGALDLDRRTAHMGGLQPPLYRGPEPAVPTENRGDPGPERGVQRNTQTGKRLVASASGQSLERRHSPHPSSKGLSLPNSRIPRTNSRSSARRARPEKSAWTCRWRSCLQPRGPRDPETQWPRVH